MLDDQTKRNLNNARDVLVGKVPDPKSQVEQITIALIYKFMDDMDKESESLGGKATFFKGEFEKYSWTNIFNPRHSGVEMLNLYGEALIQMNQNKNIPQLFRDIFKNAYLPYRDPETLKQFLKEINNFTYTHSEKLGDAYEFLLSIMSSQGDAGQFRTPRHIIDFIVSVIEPKKNETILDPACGTAGFLISSYKYILESNRDKKPGDKLTPDEKMKLANSLVGYDISPDMVRLSLVNMYLHGFQGPKIYEYDTLTSEDRWNETYDIVLANPPFMTPKGGIRPHKKFSIQANRSEVLFVDYIMEHININGRAGVIIPEGIIFQSGNAYKALRKNLIDNNYLWAVVSLPAGVFNPYSPVKTSILFVDKNIAKRTDEILFVKVENDGFDLGSQRRPIDKNDLPDATNVLNEYVDALKNGIPRNFNTKDKPYNASIVKKSKLAENGEYNLTGDRYKVIERKSKQKWSTIKLGDILKLTSGKFLPQRSQIDGDFLVYGGNGVLGKHNEYFLEKPTLIIGRVGEYCGAVHITKAKSWVTDNALLVTEYLKNVNQEFLAVLLKNMNLNNYAKRGGQPSISQTTLYDVDVPFPPIEVQEEMVAEIDGYQKIMDGAKQVVENWKPKIKIGPKWPKVKLGDLCSFMTGGTPKSDVKEYYNSGVIPWLVSGDIHKGFIYDCAGRISELGMQNSNAKHLPYNSVLIALNGQGKTRATVALLRIHNATCNQSLVSIDPKDRNILLPEFLYYQLMSMYQRIRNLTGDNERSGLNIPILKAIEIYLPDISIQKEVIEEIEEERILVESNNKLIKAYENKIISVVAEIWQS